MFHEGVLKQPLFAPQEQLYTIPPLSYPFQQQPTYAPPPGPQYSPPVQQYSRPPFGGGVMAPQGYAPRAVPAPVDQYDSPMHRNEDQQKRASEEKKKMYSFELQQQVGVCALSV